MVSITRVFIIDSFVMNLEHALSPMSTERGNAAARANCSRNLMLLHE